MNKVSVEVESKQIVVQVEETWCPGDRQWVHTAMAKLANGRAVYATADWQEDAVSLLIKKISK
jgi:hypothetical protein